MTINKPSSQIKMSETETETATKTRGRSLVHDP